MLHRPLVVILSTGFFLVAVGCSKPIVSGTVQVNDTPVSSGEIRFTRQGDEQALFSTVIAAGEFTVLPSDYEGSVAGEYEVSVIVHFVEKGEAEEYYSTVMSEPKPTADNEPHVYTETLKERGNILNYKLEQP